MAQRLFGTDGIRGTAGRFPLDAPTLARLGAALGRSRRTAGRELQIVVGRDTRESGVWIERELTRGAASEGVRLVSLGVAPTPAVAFVTKDAGFDAGVVISASHNPYLDNGIKIFSHHGVKLAERAEDDLEALVLDDVRQVDSDHLDLVTDDQLIDRYVRYVGQVRPDAGRLGPLRIAVDCAHGAMSIVAPRLFRESGFDVHTTGCHPNGRNINDGCGSTHPETLARFVSARQCRLGVAFDGDGDRAVFVDAHGEVVNGDAVLLICAKHLKQIGRLRGDAIVATVMSNLGLEVALRDLGIGLVRCAVGDKYVMEEMTARGLVFGGEQSGHIIFADHLRTGDGLITTMMLLQAIAVSGTELHALANELTIYPQVLVNVPVREKTDLQTLPDVVAVIRAIERKLAGRGRLLVRYSGTEPLLRVMVEGRDRAQIHAWADEIAGTVRQRLG